MTDNSKPANQPEEKPKSCTLPCSPSDWYKGGKCDINGCYEEKKGDPEQFLKAKFPAAFIDRRYPIATQEIDWEDIFEAMKEFASSNPQEGQDETIEALKGALQIYKESINDQSQEIERLKEENQRLREFVKMVAGFHPDDNPIKLIQAAEALSTKQKGE